MSNNDDRDPFLEALFSESVPELAEDEFTGQVILRTRRFRYLMVAGGAILALTLSVVLWWLSIPWELGRLAAHALVQPLIPLAEGWLTWLVSPVNNVGGLLVILARIGWTFRKRSRRMPLTD
ncbi:MAG: hypothetical protein HUJ31_10890 [Pseudomonadales bacterium]|nr:hypothetical protein [Pseudomonadales bacterium]